MAKDKPPTRRDRPPVHGRGVIDANTAGDVSEAEGSGEDPILGLRGLGRELWQDEDADEYARRLRSDWERAG